MSIQDDASDHQVLGIEVVCHGAPPVRTIVVVIDGKSADVDVGAHDDATHAIMREKVINESSSSSGGDDSFHTPRA